MAERSDELDAARYRAIRERPNEFWQLYCRSPELEHHFNRRGSSKQIDHGVLTDNAADRLRGGV